METLRKSVQFIIIFVVSLIVGIVLMLAGCGDGQDGAHRHNHEEHSEHMEDMEPSGTLEDGVRVVEMTARRFEFEPEKVVVRQGEKVRLKITSEDVMHGIEIEGYGIDRQLPPKEEISLEFLAQKDGHFHCSVYCGPGHDRMHGELVVLKQKESK